MLGTTIRGMTVRDPIVNGYSRRSSGLLAYRRAMPGLNVDSGNNVVASSPVASNAGVIQATTTQGGANPVRALCGVQVGSVLVFHGERGINGGPEMWIAGAYSNLSQQAVGGTQTYKVAVDGTRARAYNIGNGGKWADTVNVNVTKGTAYIYLQNDANPNNAASASYTDVVACKDNAIHFAACPLNGFIVLTVGAEAPVTIPLDAAGAATFDCDGRSFPLSVIVDIQDSAHISQATFKLATVFGGDEIGTYRLTQIDPNNFAVARSADGLLFSDNFNRSDGAPGADYAIEGGAWSISGNKLITNVEANVGRIMRLATFANRRDMHVQAIISRSDLRLFMTLLNRRVGNTWYQFHVASSTDGVNPNQPLISVSPAGGTVATAPAFGTAANVAERWTFSTIGTDQKAWVNGANAVVGANATPANQIDGGVAFQTFGNSGSTGTASIDDLIVCASRTITAVGMPNGWKIRVGALTSNAANAGATSLDIAATQLPIASIDILDDTGAIRKTFAPANGLYGGDVLQLT